MTMANMDREQLGELLSSYIDNELEHRERAFVERLVEEDEIETVAEPVALALARLMGQRPQEGALERAIFPTRAEDRQHSFRR